MLTAHGFVASAPGVGLPKDRLPGDKIAEPGMPILAVGAGRGTVKAPADDSARDYLADHIG